MPNIFCMWNFVKEENVFCIYILDYRGVHCVYESLLLNVSDKHFRFGRNM